MWKIAIILCATFVVSVVEINAIARDGTKIRVEESYRGMEDATIRMRFHSFEYVIRLSQNVTLKLEKGQADYVNKEISMINASITLASETLCKEFNECNVKLDTDIDAARTKVTSDIKNCTLDTTYKGGQQYLNLIEAEKKEAKRIIEVLQDEFSKCGFAKDNLVYLNEDCTFAILEKMEEFERSVNATIDSTMTNLKKVNTIINQDNGVGKFFKSDPCIHALKLERFTSIHIVPIIDRANECINKNGGCAECE